ncbi:MAG: hypothetical protein SFY32_12980 [Bacteroidota bacterium]|nr:hypothetical protein [Bacteroidota bacterium]
MNKRGIDFMQIVVVQFLIIADAIIFEDLLSLLGFANISQLACQLIFMIVGFLYLTLLWRLLRSFNAGKMALNGTLFLLCVSFCIGMVAANPFIEVFESPIKRVLLFVIQIGIFTSQIIIIYHTIIEIFREDISMNERLWGSAAVYLMIGLSLGSLYDFIAVINPNALGPYHELSLSGYLLCLKYSMHILGALDSIFPDAISLVKNIGIMEAVWSHLFVCLLVGRLLSK